MSLSRRTSSRKQADEGRAEPDRLLGLDGIEEILEQGCFSRAYKEARKAIAHGKDRERCLRILGRAAYGLRQWVISMRHYEELRHAFPYNEDAKGGLQAAISRLDEEGTGSYEFAKLYEVARRGETDVDVADYVGPIQVVDISGKGKGIVPTRDVEKGTLLLVSKAFAIAPGSLPDSALVTAIEEKLTRQPEIVDEVAGLYYGCERDAATTQESNLQSVTDRTRLKRLCRYNAFDAEPFIGAPKSWTQQGLWILPSYFNHSCLGRSISFTSNNNSTSKPWAVRSADGQISSSTICHLHFL